MSSMGVLQRLDQACVLSLYRKMLQIRFFENKIEYGFARGQISGTTHLCIGQEAVAAGVCAHLTDKDYVVSNHRGHGHALAKGLCPTRLMAEIMGKASGYCKGKGGTQHVACIEKGFLGTNGITGGGIPIATGAGLTIKYQQRHHVSVCFFGDGASNQGAFHESLNIASLWGLPVLFVCENNLYAMSTPLAKSTASDSIVQRAQAYRITGQIVDGMDVLDVYERSCRLIEQIRDGSGPALLECRTYRFTGHSKSDPRVYRTRDEEAIWKARCPIARLKGDIVAYRLADVDVLDRLEDEVRLEIEHAYEVALEASVPESAEAFKGVFHGQ